MSTLQVSRLIGASQAKDGKSRVDKDFYPTPPFVTETLLKNERFEGNIWEPACGDGAISEILKSHNYSVFSSDIKDYGYSSAKTGIEWDFEKKTLICDNIITNPPFSLGTMFALHALDLVDNKVALFLKLAFLEGKEREKKLYSQRHLETVYVFTNRVKFGKQYKSGGMMAFAWFVWNKNFKGDPKIKWV